MSSVSSYDPTKGNADLTLRSSLSLQSIASRFSNSELQYSHGVRSGFPSYNLLPQLSVAEVIDDPGGGKHFPKEERKHTCPCKRDPLYNVCFTGTSNAWTY